MKYTPPNDSLQTLVDPLLPESSFYQVGKTKLEGPHINDDDDIMSSVHHAQVRVRSLKCKHDEMEFHAKRRVVTARDGACALPYFLSNNQWKIILIEQFRIAVGKATLEAPGGVVENEENVLKTMARELEEEAGLKVQPDQIELRFREYYLPSLLNGRAWGGIVEVNKKKHPGLDEPTLVRERESGRDSYTVRRAYFLDEVLSLLGNNSLDVIDLWSARLIAEVAMVTREK